MNSGQTNESENLIAAAIDAAEDIRDPLEGLVERTATDPGAPFAPDALERLAALKKDERAAFEALRAQLKSAGCRVTALDEAIAERERRRRRARTDAGRYPDRTRAIGRTVSHGGRHRLRRPRHQRPPGDLADPCQGLPPLAGAPLLRGDARARRVRRPCNRR